MAPTMLERTATLADIGNVAVFAASDLAGSMTGTVLNTSPAVHRSTESPRPPIGRLGRTGVRP